MALPQIFRHPFDPANLHQTVQVAQISYHNERIITVDYNVHTNRPMVVDNDQWFELTSPDLDNGFTMRDVFQALGYQNELMELTYPYGANLENYLDTLVQNAPLSQLNFTAQNNLQLAEALDDIIFPNEAAVLDILVGALLDELHVNQPQQNGQPQQLLH